MSNENPQNNPQHVRYDSMKILFVTSVVEETPREFSKRSGVADPKDFEQYILAKDWEYERKQFKATYMTKVKNNLRDIQVGDVTQKLLEIQAMKNKAFEEALKKTFKDAGQAMASYIDLEKLERLIMGESTENVRVQDLDKYMMGVALIIRRTIPEGPMLDEVIHSLSTFTFADAKRMDFNLEA